jgi:hypothetical protein
LISTGTTGGPGGSRAVVDVSWVEMEIPDVVVVSASPVKVKVGGTFTTNTRKVKLSGTFTDNTTKIKLGGSFNG